MDERGQRFIVQPGGAFWFVVDLGEPSKSSDLYRTEAEALASAERRNKSYNSRLGHR